MDIPADGLVLESKDLLVDENLHLCFFIIKGDNYMVHKETV
jgi:hypothetical protein